MFRQMISAVCRRTFPGNGGQGSRTGWGGLAAAMAVLMLATAIPVHAQTYAAQITSYSTDEFLVSTWQPVTLKVKNIGLTGPITVFATAQPSGWAVQANEGDSTTQVTHIIRQGSSENFKFKVAASPYQGSGSITWEVWGVTLQGFNIQLVKVDQAVHAVYPPGDFSTFSPSRDQSGVSLTPTFQWSASSGATDYSLELFDDIAGAAATTSFYQSPWIQATTLQYDGPTSLEYSQRYWWQVTARNDYAQTVNLNGPAPFTVMAAPALGPFTIYSPSPDGQYPQLPTVWWSLSANAVKYGIKVYEDVGGQPASTPLAPEVDVTGYQWNWTNYPIAKGKRYWVYVTAYSSSVWVPALAANNSPVRFLYSGLSPFTLVTPYDISDHVSLQPYFEWNNAAGATGYRIEIRGADPVNSGFFFSDTTTNPNYQYNGGPLTPNAHYRWTVYALGDQEELQTLSGSYLFKTVDIQPFLLTSPAYGEEGVAPVPTFFWEPIQGSDVQAIYVEIWEDNDAVPGVKVHIHTSYPPLPPTATSYPYYGGVTLERGHRYYWRVLAEMTDGPGRYNIGDLRPFTITKLGNFNLISPGDLSTGVSVKPTFQWQPSANADRYSLAVWLADENLQPRYMPIFMDNDIPSTVTEYQYTGPPALTGQTEFAWQVYAWQGSHWMSSSSPVWRFKTETQSAWFGVGVKEYVLGEGYLVGEETITNADSQSSNGVIDIGDVVGWEKYNALYGP